MKRATLLGALAVGMVFGVAVWGWAQTDARPTAVDNEMKAMDTNGDGKISAEEHAAGVSRMFTTMDANTDGKVTASEMTAAHDRVTGTKPAKGEMTAAEKIKTIDTNGDGILTADEHAAGARTMFDRMDTDKDGFLSKAELAAGHAMKMRK